MQMIDVLKRLAELDDANPRVEKTMTQEQSLATITNIEGEQVNECGPMGMPSDLGRPKTPASFSVNASAESGAEVADMISQIMNLAGVKGSEPTGAEILDKEVELGTPHGIEVDGGNDDMADMIGMIDRMNGPEEPEGNPEDEGLGGALAGGAIGALAGGPLGALTGAAAGDSLTDPDPKEKVEAMTDEVQGMADELADRNEEGYDNSPEEEVRGHTYGDDQVSPKPQGFKQRVGDNPYEPTSESVEAVALRLMKEYSQFVAESSKR